MTNLVNRIKKSQTVSKTGTVLFGTIISQVLIIGSVPFLSRIYDVNDFGNLGMFMLISMFGIQLFNWRYDYGIVSSKTLDNALSIIALCITASLISSLIFAILLSLLSSTISLKTDFDITQQGIYLVVYAFSYAIWNTLTFLNIKISQFKLNARINILRAVLIVSFSFLFYFINFTNGLILGLVVAQGISTMTLTLFSFNNRRKTNLNISKFHPQQLKKVAFENGSLFKYSFPSAAVEIVSGQLPQFFIGTFGSTIFGWFSQANRLLNAPLDLIGQSVRSVFWESASFQFINHNNCLQLFDTTLKRLFIISIIPFITLFIISPWLFRFILGPEWERAGDFARILIPLCFFRFLSNPLSSMFYIANKQKYDFAIQLSVLCVIGILYLVSSTIIRNPENVIGIYSAVYSLKYIAELGFSRRFAKNQIR